MTAAPTMRATCAPVIADAVAGDERVITLGADGQALFTGVLRDHPGRYVETGIAESNLVGVAAGLARTGRIPVVGAMAPFLVRRAYEQICLDVCVPRLPVVLLGVGGGVGYGHLGPSHHAPDDVALMSALPHMRVHLPADAEDAADLLRWLLPPTGSVPGPAYVRLAARPDPAAPAAPADGTDHDARHGAEQRPGHDPERGPGHWPGHDPGPASGEDPRAVRLLRTGTDALIVAAGRCVPEALDAAHQLAAGGVRAAVAAVRCLRPFPAARLRALAAGVPLVVTACEALEPGGLGQRTESALSGEPARVVRLELDHRYPPVASHEELLRFYGVDATVIRTTLLQHLTTEGS
ncbi:transketolase C-terminal domain-containing protein [Streptomyces winkii]|uniref:transketolase C-terminal domain-containing protein n=1 Tax=Streptomyces winkii TaxID=3051178 RepID=UPI0028D1D733|nr:transketolase C-terminal domain-containing protein [Streptomyces sp. DSM 40971]